MQPDKKPIVRYCGSFGKIESFSTPDWPELAIEINSGMSYHLVVISDHELWVDMSKQLQNSEIANVLRHEGVSCPDDVLDVWSYVSRGNF